MSFKRGSLMGISENDEPEETERQGSLSPTNDGNAVPPPRPTSKPPGIPSWEAWKEDNTPNYQEAAACSKVLNKIERDSRTGSIFLSSPDNLSAGGKVDHGSSSWQKKSGIGRRATFTLNAMKDKFFSSTKDSDEATDYKLTRKDAVRDISSGIARSHVLEQQELIVELLALLESRGFDGTSDKAFQAGVSKLRSKAESMLRSFKAVE